MLWYRIGCTGNAIAFVITNNVEAIGCDHIGVVAMVFVITGLIHASYGVISHHTPMG